MPSSEELYDLANDPDEVHNLAGSAAHHEVLAKLRDAQRSLALQIRDVGFLPEGEIHSRSVGTTPYDMGHDASKYPLERILAVAEAAAGLEAQVRETLATIQAVPGVSEAAPGLS